MADTIGILLTTEQFLKEEDVDEIEDDIFPFLLNSHNFEKQTFCQFKDVMKKLNTMSSSDFERHFRLLKETVNRIMQEIEPDISNIVRTMGKKLIVPIIFL